MHIYHVSLRSVHIPTWHVWYQRPYIPALVCVASVLFLQAGDLIHALFQTEQPTLVEEAAEVDYAAQLNKRIKG
jgi:hypothetical protein